MVLITKTSDQTRPCVCVCVYKMKYNSANRPCHRSHSMRFSLVLPRGTNDISNKNLRSDATRGTYSLQYFGKPSRPCFSLTASSSFSRSCSLGCYLLNQRSLRYAFYSCHSRSTPVAQLAPRNLLTRWDVSSIPANGIFLTKN